MPGPKIAVVGACQVTGLQRALAALIPASTITAWHVGGAHTAGEVKDALPDHDFIVSQVADLSGEDGLMISHLRERYGNRVVFVPTVIFTGLQPDAIYLSNGGGPIPSFTGVMHSALIAAAFSLDVPERDVPALFNARVYEAAGYLDAFDDARARMLEQYAHHGFDLAGHMARWMEQGSFMHLPNHPRADVLATLATMAAERLGIVTPGTEPPAIDDYLGLHERWPVYPEIARQAGVEGSLTWMRGLDILPPGQPREASLAEVVAAEYATHRAHPGERPDMRIRRAREAIQAH